MGFRFFRNRSSYGVTFPANARPATWRRIASSFQKSAEFADNA